MNKITLLALMILNAFLLNAQSFSEILAIDNFSERPECFEISNNYLYVGGGTSGSGSLSVYNVHNPAKPVFINEIVYSDFEVYDLLIDNSQLFVAGEDGVKIYDITTPENITLLTTITEVADGTESRKLSTWFIAKNDNTIFVESGWSGLISVDISDIYNPKFLDLLSHTGIASDMVIYDNTTAFFVDGYYLYKVDISSPSNLTKTSLDYKGDQASLFLYKDKIFISSDATDDYLTIVNPSLLTIEKEVNVNDFLPYDEAYSYALGGISVNNDTLIISGSDGVLLVDISNDYAPVEYIRNSTSGTAAKELLYFNGNIYLAAGNNVLVFGRSGETAIQRKQVTSICTLYPNPAKEQISIETEKTADNLKIINSTGQTVYSLDKPSSNSITIQFDNYVRGIYIVQIKTDNQLIHKKFIVE